MKKMFLFTFLFSICFLKSQIRVSGSITYKGKGIAGVSITLKDTYDGATSNENGTFEFETSETGDKSLVFQHPKYIDVEKNIHLGSENTVINVEMKEQVNEIDAVVISAGSIEASDRKRAGASLSPLDIYRTAGADGQISKALTYLPGVQKVGESEGLFIRGGSASEAKIFMDGSLVNNYFSSSVPGIAGRDRFNTSLFKGNIFSSGGYSALYGQALSGVLLLESVDLPEKSAYNFGVSPIFLNAGFQKLGSEKKFSFGASATYSMLDFMQKIFNFNTDFVKAPESFNMDANFRIKTKGGGMIKYYGMFDTNAMGVKSPSLEPEYEFSYARLKSKNTFQSLSYREKFKKYVLNVSGSYTYTNSDLSLSTENQNVETPSNFMNTKFNYLNFKAVLERKINRISAIRGGFELNNTHEDYSYSGWNREFKDLTSAAFVETDLGFSNHFSTKIGVRAEHSSFFDKSNIAPRLAFAYKISKNWTSSVATGIFYQNPESKYLNADTNLGCQKASHYILQFQRNTDGRNLRFEAFYKKYNDLVKTAGTNYFQTAINNNGNGYAKGLEVFWWDKKSFDTFDYWITYSYLDSKRDYMNFPNRLQPTFVAEYTLSVVTKKFVMDWKTGFNLSYSYAKGRPYYDIVNSNGNGFVRTEGHLKDYNSLTFSVNYLPNFGKKDSKAFTVFVLSISNILGSKQVYGYNFSQDGMRSAAVVPPVNTFVFVGAFISFGVDRTQDAINNNL